MKVETRRDVSQKNHKITANWNTNNYLALRSLISSATNVPGEPLKDSHLMCTTPFIRAHSAGDRASGRLILETMTKSTGQENPSVLAPVHTNGYSKDLGAVCPGLRVKPHSSTSSRETLLGIPCNSAVMNVCGTLRAV